MGYILPIRELRNLASFNDKQLAMGNRRHLFCYHECGQMPFNWVVTTKKDTFITLVFSWAWFSCHRCILICSFFYVKQLIFSDDCSFGYTYSPISLCVSPYFANHFFKLVVLGVRELLTLIVRRFELHWNPTGYWTSCHYTWLQGGEACVSGEAL